MRGIIKKLGRGVRSVFRRRWARRLTVSLVIIGILAGIGAFALHYINGPSASTITATIPTAPAKPVGKVSLQGTYADFTYPDEFTVSPVQPAQSPELAAYKFVSHASETVILAIEIDSIPSGNISDNGGYYYRKVTPTRFTQVIQTINGQQVYIMTDTQAAQAYAKVGFFVHGDKTASVAISGGEPNETAAIDKVMSDIISSWVWHN